MSDRLNPDPGFEFQSGSQQAGPIWITELIRIVNKKCASAVTDLDQTISNPPTQAEVQALSDKVDELLAALRAAGLMET